MLINNVIFGTRSAGWTNSISIRSNQLDYACHLAFSKSQSRVKVEGSISHNDEPIYKFSGYWMEKQIYLEPLNDDYEKILLTDPESFQFQNLIIPESREDVPHHNTTVVWREVSEAIVNGDLNKADQSKKLIEEAQRERINGDMPHQMSFFTYDEQSGRYRLSSDKLEEYNEQYPF